MKEGICGEEQRGGGENKGGEGGEQEPEERRKCRSFWKSIGEPRFVMAPMVDASELAFRLLCRKFGVELAYTPMLHSRLFVEDSKYRAFHWDILPRRVSPKNSNGIASEGLRRQQDFWEEKSREEEAEEKEKEREEEAKRRSWLYDDGRRRRRVEKKAGGEQDDGQETGVGKDLQNERERGAEEGEGESLSDEPVIVQFCGDSPEILLQASKWVEGKVDAVDLNFGCPQGIARRGHYGAFLLDEPHLMTELVSTLSKNLEIPVTCKIRKVSSSSCSDRRRHSALSARLRGGTAAVDQEKGGQGDEGKARRGRLRELREEERYLQDTLHLCYALEAAGCSALCVHGRTKEEKSQHTRECDWTSIRHIKARLSIPVIANGGVETYEDSLRCLRFTGADAVMSAEGLLDNPSLFSPSLLACPPLPLQHSSSSSSLGRTGYPAGYNKYSDGLLTHRFFSSFLALYSARKSSFASPFGLNVFCTVDAQSPDDLSRCFMMEDYLSLCEVHPPPHSSYIKSHLFRCLYPILHRHTDLRERLAKTCVHDEFVKIVKEAKHRSHISVSSSSSSSPSPSSCCFESSEEKKPTSSSGRSPGERLQEEVSSSLPDEGEEDFCSRDEDEEKERARRHRGREDRRRRRLTWYWRHRWNNQEKEKKEEVQKEGEDDDNEGDCALLFLLDE